MLEASVDIDLRPALLWIGRVRIYRTFRRRSVTARRRTSFSQPTETTERPLLFGDVYVGGRKGFG